MRVRIPLVVLGSDGRPLAGATMVVRDRITGTTDTVYAAETGGTTLTAPQQVSDAQGRLPGWTGRGRKQATITPPPGSGLSPYVESWDAAPAGNDDVEADWIDTSGGTGLVAVRQADGSITWQAASAAQLADQSLKTIAGLVPAADRFPYYTGAASAALATLSAAGRALIDDADADAQLSTLGFSAFMKTIVNDLDAAAARRTLVVGIERIATVELAGSQATIDFSGIPALYDDLELVLYARSTAAAASADVLLTFNNDGGANYDHVRSVIRHSANLSTGEGVADTKIQIGYASGATGPANAFDATEVVIPAYRRTVGQKALRSKGTLKQGTATGTFYVMDVSGYWRSTAAINRLTLSLSSGNFAAGTLAVLYGRGA